MSFYAISDLHGYPLDKFKALLAEAGFCAEDTLYIIGDVIDRNGDGGVELLRYITEQPNFEFILGNHEDMLLACEFVFEEITDDSIETLTPENTRALERYLRNGGGVTLESLGRLKREEPQAFSELMLFLKEAPLIGAVTAAGRDFLLVHGGFNGFEKSKKLSDYSAYDLLWARPTLETRYFEDIMTVIGHTPTFYLGEQYRGSIVKTDTFINIDAGASIGLAPALLRLDDLAEFYGE